MNVSLPQAGNQSPTRIARPQMSQTADVKDASPTTSDGDFDLTVLNHSREMYFLPGMDRLAATLASKAQAPIQVRMEAKGQYLEYVIDGKHPEAVIEASLNGSPFKMIPKQNDDGSWDMNADTTGGTVAGTITQEPQGTHFGGLITAPGEEARFCTERIALGQSGSDDVATVSGNFACSRMMENFTREDGGLRIEGVMGDYKIDGKLDNGPNGTLVKEIDLGNIHFHQTFTPLSSDPTAALNVDMLKA